MEKVFVLIRITFIEILSKRHEFMEGYVREVVVC